MRRRSLDLLLSLVPAREAAGKRPDNAYYVSSLPFARSGVTAGR
jgi:hypothetical protein